MATRKPFYLRYIEDPPADGGKGPDSSGGGGGNEADMPHGFPKDTPLVEMTVEQREAYWKYHARKHEGVANSRADYDQQKADAEKWRQYQEQNKTPDQKAIDTAAETARIEERNKTATRLVKAEFKAAAASKGVTKELLDAFLEDVNHTVYLKADGDVDEDKVMKRVELLAPKGQQPRKPNHQGYRPSDGVTSVAAGRSLFESRQKK